MNPATPESLSALPLLDTEIADVLFAVDRESEQMELRSMLQELESDVGTRLDSLIAQAATLTGLEAKRTCHPLKGNTGSFGLARCSAVMAQLEHGWEATPLPLRSALLVHAREWLNAGVQALRTRFPYLADLG